MAQRDPAQQQGDSQEPRLPDMDEADARNGEPAALRDEQTPRSATNRTGEEQAEQNRENELPA
jgi:hypothetical protein